MIKLHDIKHFSPGILLLLLLACPPAFAIKQQMNYVVEKPAKQTLLHIHAPENKYLYNGKELVDDEGINLYDYGFRFYDAALGRWHVIDALSEIDYNFSPYSYAHNNPINSYDAMGLKVEYLYEDDKIIGYEITGDDVLSYYGYLEDIYNDKGTMENLQWALEDAASSNESTGGLMASTIEEATINLHLSIDELIDILNAKPRPYPEEKGLENTYPELIFFPVAKSINSVFKVGTMLGKSDKPKVTTGQSHHLLSNKIMRTINNHKNLKGAFNRNNSIYVYNALDNAAHRGYQTWHRKYDAKVVEWIQSNPNATPAQFNKFLHKLHQQPWLKNRIPNVNLKN